MRHEAARITIPIHTISTSPCRITPMVMASVTSTAMVRLAIRLSIHQQRTQQPMLRVTEPRRLPSICLLPPHTNSSTLLQVLEYLLPYRLNLVRIH